MISSIMTVILAGLTTGGLLISRRVDPHQTLLIIVGMAFFLFCFIGMFIGGKVTGFVSPTAISIIFGLFCFALIGFLIFKYDPAFGYVKQEPASLAIFVVFFFLIGMEMAILEVSIWMMIVFTAVFVGGLVTGALLIFRVIHSHRTTQLLALLPLVPLLFIGLFKLL